MSEKEQARSGEKAVERQRPKPLQTQEWATAEQQADMVSIVQQARRDPRRLFPSSILLLQQTIGNSYVQRLIESVAFQPRRIANASDDITVQRKWTVPNVDEYLSRDKQGKETITNLNSQGYEVIHIDKYRFERQFYKDEECTQKVGSPVEMARKGWHIRKRREIALSDEPSDSGAASTLVHEVAHAEEHKLNEAALAKGQERPFADLKAKELDAHIKQAEFNLARGIAQKDPSFVKDGKIDEKAIEAYVERVYGIQPGVSKEIPRRDT